MRVFASVFAAAFLAMSGSMLAQWPTYPTPNVPKNPDGTPNLNAPPPRMPDGKVDFSGIWEAGLGGGGGRGRGGAGGGAAAGGAARGGRGARGDAARGGGARGDAAVAAPGTGGAPARGRGPVTLPADGTPPLATFFDIGAGIPGGAPMTPWAQEVRKQRMANDQKDNPDAHCLPIGHMQLHLHPQPRKYLQTANEMVMIWEANYGLRHIFLDGRPSPDNDPQPWWYGYTVGRWEGNDTLVATTTGLRDGMWLDVYGTPLTDQGKIIERFTRPTFGRMIIDITIEDPKAFTKPFTVRVNQRIMLNSELIEFICNENEQSSLHYAK